MLRIIFTLVLLLSSSSSYGQDCGFFDALYIPHPNYKPTKYGLTLKFKPVHELDSAPFRKYFFEFHAFDLNTKKPLSRLRLASTCSNGQTICRASTYYGQYNSLDNLEDFETPVSLEYKFLKKDFTDLGDSAAQAPYAIMFMNNIEKFNFNSRDTKYYIQHLSEDKTYPDFSGKDVWIFDNCRNFE